MTEMKRRRFDQLIEQAGGNHESAIFDVLEEMKEKIERLQETMEGRLVKVESGFPGGDPEEHRRYHEALINKIKARTEFWQKLVFELAKLGLLGFACWAAVALWAALVKGPK